ncbi:putative HTH iclR-type domain-containing protein [Pararobbsia alpina]|uniref:hypothetical protein n=1 Tax=Pararobbsia alpina TaxID=621374 RepID=UPI0039A4DD1B
MCNFDWTLALEYLKVFVSWPVAAVIAAFALRHQLGALIKALRKLKVGDTEIEFAEQIANKVTTDVLTATAPALNELLTPITEPDDAEQETVETERGKSEEESIQQSWSGSLDAPESRVLEAMMKSGFIRRSVTGVAKDSGLPKALVRATFGVLVTKGLLETVQAYKSEQMRWKLTPTGRYVASMVTSVPMAGISKPE